MRRLAVLLALLSSPTLLACASSSRSLRASATVTIAEAAPERPSDAAAPETEVLVWSFKADGKPATRWLSASPTGYSVVAEVPGILVSSNGEVWRWEERSEEVKTQSCAEIMGEGTGLDNLPGTGKVTRVSMARLGSNTRVEVVKPPTGEGVNDVDHTVTILGSAGPYVFVRESSYEYHCGAHGGVGASLVVWDLSSGSSVDILKLEERSAIGKRESGEALRQLAEEHEGEEPGKDDVVQLIATVPHYSPGGHLQVEHVFTAFACYACGQSEWGSYMHSTNVRARSLPELLRPFERPTALVSAYAAANRGETLGGWSILPADAARTLKASLRGS